MGNCIFEIRQGRSRVLGVHRVEGEGTNPWHSVCQSFRDARDSVTLAGANLAGEAVVSIGILDLPCGLSRPARPVRLAQ